MCKIDYVSSEKCFTTQGHFTLTQVEILKYILRYRLGDTTVSSSAEVLSNQSSVLKKSYSWVKKVIYNNYLRILGRYDFIWILISGNEEIGWFSQIIVILTWDWSRRLTWPGPSGPIECAMKFHNFHNAYYSWYYCYWIILFVIIDYGYYQPITYEKFYLLTM